ncbi:unnamed protein product [Ranitomeya imitator]|uniref:Uncharacterized protein n=1 Tax=Ranitomeya imitator TaxID=111125 RepID=A0ABN9LNY9_9NEOB|nr:unnamed protein product [Ranitomeya imitator]
MAQGSLKLKAVPKMNTAKKPAGMRKRARIIAPEKCQIIHQQKLKNVKVQIKIPVKQVKG